MGAKSLSARAAGREKYRTEYRTIHLMITRHERIETAASPIIVVPFLQGNSNLTPAKLRRAAKLRKEIDSLRRKLGQVLSTSAK